MTAFVLAAMLDQQDIMRVGLLASALPLLAAASVARTRFRLASDRTVDPSRTPAGESATVTVRLENVAHLPTGLLMVTLVLKLTGVSRLATVSPLTNPE
ncbi:MAG: hypothetical protein ABI586_11855 [Candidatus Nanopelagicales bacterium]